MNGESPLFHNSLSQILLTTYLAGIILGNNTAQFGVTCKWKSILVTCIKTLLHNYIRHRKQFLFNTPAHNH